MIKYLLIREDTKELLSQEESYIKALSKKPENIDCIIVEYKSNSLGVVPKNKDIPIFTTNYDFLTSLRSNFEIANIINLKE